MQDADLADVVDLERSLLDPDVRSEQGRVLELLADDFVEFGASGRVWDKRSMVAALVADPRVPVVVTSLSAARLGEDAILVTYRTTGRPDTLRSSTWVRDAEGRWRLRFHQGTRVNQHGSV